MSCPAFTPVPSEKGKRDRSVNLARNDSTSSGPFDPLVRDKQELLAFLTVRKRNNFVTFPVRLATKIAAILGV
jgi:hypothetical protein